MQETHIRLHASFLGFLLASLQIRSLEFVHSDTRSRLHPKMSLKTTVQCRDNGDLVMSADVSMKSIGTTFIDNQPDEVAQRLQTVTCGLAGGLIKAVQGQAEAEETATGPKEIEDLASGQYLRTAKVDVTGRLPLILNCASSGETTVVFNFRFETHVTMCRIGLTREFYEALKAFAQHAAQPLEKLRFSHMGDTRMTVGFLNGATPVDVSWNAFVLGLSSHLGANSTVA